MDMDWQQYPNGKTTSPYSQNEPSDAFPPPIFRFKDQKLTLEMVNLSDRLDHYPSELSGGQQQRVAIARAIVTDPTLIVADEPTGDLDRHAAAEVLELLNRLNQELDKTVIMVTHDALAAARARSVVHLDKGELIHADRHADA